MGKLDELRRGAGGNATESMGGRDRREPSPSAPPAGRSTVERPRYQGLERLKGANEIAVERLTRDPSQPREIFDEAALQELVESIESLGVLQPIRVRWDEELSMYVVIAGERRLRAAKMAGLKAVPCVIQEGALTESQRLIEQLAENIIRADLQPVEQAKAFRRLMDLNSWSARQLAREMHIADANIVRALALLELPGGVQAEVEAGRLAPSVAYEVSRLDTPEEQADLAERVVAEKLTRDQVADVVKARKQGRGAASTATGRAEFRLDGGRKVTLSGLPDDRPETILAALKEVTKTVQARAREAARGGAEAGDQAA
jgi:ParB family chromosome partitioning protein